MKWQGPNKQHRVAKTNSESSIRRCTLLTSFPRSPSIPDPSRLFFSARAHRIHLRSFLHCSCFAAMPPIRTQSASSSESFFSDTSGSSTLVSDGSFGFHHTTSMSLEASALSLPETNKTKTRKRITPVQLKRLEKLYKKDTHPSREQREELAKQLDMYAHFLLTPLTHLNTEVSFLQGTQVRDNLVPEQAPNDKTYSIEQCNQRPRELQQLPRQFLPLQHPMRPPHLDVLPPRDLPVPTSTTPTFSGTHCFPLGASHAYFSLHILASASSVSRTGRI